MSEIAPVFPEIRSTLLLRKDLRASSLLKKVSGTLPTTRNRAFVRRSESSRHLFQQAASRGTAVLRTLIAIIFASQFLTGCAHNMNRRMTIRSEPPGALVLMEGEEVGYTPVGIDFNHYGTREITLIKDGYETVTAMQKVRSPWYQKIPLDFVSDNFSPVKINDRLDYTFTMNKQELVSNDQLLQRAKGLRSQSQVLPKQPEQ